MPQQSYKEMGYRTLLIKGRRHPLVHALKIRIAGSFMLSDADFLCAIVQKCHPSRTHTLRIELHNNTKYSRHQRW